MPFIGGQSHVKCRNSHPDRNLVPSLSGKRAGCWVPFTCAVPNAPLANFGTTADPMTTSALAGAGGPASGGAGALTGCTGNTTWTFYGLDKVFLLHC